MGRVVPIPADTGQAEGHTLDTFPVHQRADMSRKTTIHAHIYAYEQFKSAQLT